MKENVPEAVFADRSVSMTDASDHLSELADTARKEGTVLITRYKVPWVCISAYDSWAEIFILEHSRPNDDHPLSLLRRAIDKMLAYEAELVLALAAKAQGGMPGQMLIRAWLLQIVYSVGGARKLWRRLRVDLEWKWFVGYAVASELLPDTDAFVHDIGMVSSDPRVIEIVFRCLSNNSIIDTELSEFSVNTDLIQALHARSATAGQARGSDNPVAGSVSS